MQSKIRYIVAGVLILLALGMIAVGAVTSRKVYEKDSSDFEEFGILTYIQIPESQLIIDSTFSGVIREDGKLYSTYDRSQARGKQACPT